MPQEIDLALLTALLLTLGVVCQWIAGGVALGQVLKRHRFPDYLQNQAGLAMVLLVFTSSNALGEESGLIAVRVT
jgi:NhaP-type Na+/H+ and K+/H+ antiporter